MVGGVARDRSGNSNNGNLINIATSTFYTLGKIGQGLNFDGNNDYVSTGNITLGTNSVTVSAWIYSSNFQHNGMIVTKSPVNGDWALFVENGAASEGSPGIKLRGANSSGIYASFPTNNKWHHVVGTIAGTTGTIYVDGVQVSTGTVTAISNTTDIISIGRYAESGGGYYFSGKIDDVRVYNRAISATEVQQLYNLGK